MFTEATDGPLLKAGFTASSRNFKKATERNRIKRVTKEAYRLQKGTLETKLAESNQPLILFLLYTGKELPEFKPVQEKIALILQRLITITDERHAATT